MVDEYCWLSIIGSGIAELLVRKKDKLLEHKDNRDSI
jgi:hypothetical protein